MNDVEKYEAIEALFEKAIRPALQGDGGDLELDLVKGNEVIISFQGACGHCPSSSGSTLAGIERAIRQNVFEEAIVIPTNDYESRQPTQQEHPFGGKTYEEQVAERTKPSPGY
jgi:Fe-S cluster biogenesis protein NfuA